MKKENIYPIDREVFKDEKEDRLKELEALVSINRNEEANLFQYEKANSASTGLYEPDTY
ncbi:hypothetical protein [Clostridium sulfidigenes]|uniref:hypothetical protein n=1 Tax=Clostridium sulfidigenes TaxID=318464 RepID=UPI000B300728|nr:hypothetical protein [Clostridium sulfidigenes]